jgi:hypothetical protein
MWRNPAAASRLFDIGMVSRWSEYHPAAAEDPHPAQLGTTLSVRV